MRYLKAAAATAIFAFLLFSLWSYYSARNDTEKMPDRYGVIDRLENEGVIAFQSIQADGTPFSSESLAGKVVILNFWASWCAPCVTEFPSMIKLVEHYKGKVAFVAISQDRQKEDIINFLSAMESPSSYLTVLWDKDKKVSETYGVERLPETFIIRKNGKLERKVIGVQEWSDSNALVFFDSLVNEPI